MPSRRIFAIALLFIGCSFKVHNIRPDKPYDFVLLNHMAKYAQSAYSDAATIRRVCNPEFSDILIRTIPSTNNQYFLATSTVTHTQLLAVAGTANLENVLLDADQTRLDIPALGISLHRGFSRAAALIYNDVKAHRIPGYRWLITGHSLGGAEALILGMTFKSAGLPVDGIITFGQPKVTDADGAAAFKDLPLIRVVNQNDLIPELPLSPYQHIGPELVLFSSSSYSVVEMRPLDPAAVLAAWQALQHHKPPAELPQHTIASYLEDLLPKTTESQWISYPSLK